MLAALPLGFLTTGDFKDTAQSTKQALSTLETAFAAETRQVSEE